jgi:hypothetical protein
MDDEIIDDGVIDDENKNDEFKISINNLVLLNRPGSVIKMSELLDDNGYFGRYKIHRRLTKVNGDTIITVEIYLPNSTTYYTWPFKTFYNLTSKKMFKRVRLKKVPAMKYIICQLICYKWDDSVEKFDSLPEFLARENFSYAFDYYRTMVKYLIDAGLFTTDNNKVVFKLKSVLDIKEVVSNLFIDEMWPD